MVISKRSVFFPARPVELHFKVSFKAPCNGLEGAVAQYAGFIQGLTGPGQQHVIY